MNQPATLVVTNTATDYLSSGQLVTNTTIFSYTNRAALLGAGWNFMATNPDGTPRNTEITNAAAGALVSYDQASHPGSLRVPCDLGDLWA